jgi:ERCC4-type nuclease
MSCQPSTSQPSLTLPALKSLGDLSRCAPRLIIDTRESQPLIFTRLRSIRGTLYSGDYSIQNLEREFSVERKGSIDELASCCVGENRDRFARELHRLRGFRFKRLLIIGSEEAIHAHRYRSNISPKSVLGSLYTWQVRFDIPLAWCQTPEAAARLIELWAYYYCREIVHSANELLRGCREDPIAAKALLEGSSSLGRSSAL